MRTVYLVNLSFGLAGIERRFANLWRILHQRGRVFPVLVIPSSLASLLREADLLPYDPAGLLVVEEPAPSKLLARAGLPHMFDLPIGIVRSRIVAVAFRKAWRHIRRDASAIVHVGLNVSPLRPPDVPAVYECVDASLKQLCGRHYRRAARRRSIVHCQTDRIRAALDTEFAGRTPLWRTVTNPTYFAHYVTSLPPEIRDRRLIVFVGRLSPEKNPLLFIEAIARTRSRGIECRAIMLGEGPLRGACDALISHAGLGSAVSIDFVPDPMSVVQRAAIFVTLQTDDNYGSQSLLEAMGAGCAIVASDVGETARIVTEKIGIRVPLTANAVSAAIEQLLSSPRRTELMGAHAADVARTTYSADRYAAFLESLYDDAVEYHRTPTLRDSRVETAAESQA